MLEVSDRASLEEGLLWTDSDDLLDELAAGESKVSADRIGLKFLAKEAVF